jgi:hypothetical protein
VFEAEDAANRRLEGAITGLRGVRRARVELESGRVKQARVLVIPERSTAESLAEVIAVIRRETGTSPLPGVVEILRPSNAEPNPLSRRKLSSISTERTPDRFKARVVIELGGDTLIGESDSPSEKSFEFRSIARATLESVRELLPDHVDLESVEILQAGAFQLAVVSLRHHRGPLVGSALVRVDFHDSIARATLDALNRYVSAPRNQSAAAALST